MPAELGQRYTEAEAAAELGLTVHTLRRLRYARRIGHVRPSPRTVVYYARHLADFVARNEIPPCPDGASTSSGSAASTSAASQARPSGTSAGTTLPTVLPGRDAEAWHGRS
jgi:hypothetical protein